MNSDGGSRWRISCWWFLPPALGQKWGGVRGKCGVTAVSSLSLIQDKWDCRYEQSSNYSDDIMGDPGSTQSHYHHLHSTLHGAYTLCEELCVFVYFSKQFSLGTVTLSNVMLPQWKLVHDPYLKKKDAHFLLPSGMPVLPQERGAP